MKNFLRLAALLAVLAFTAPVEAANRFAVCSVTCTWDNASTAMWSTTTGGGTGASVPGASDAVILDAATCVGGVTCTVTVAANVSGTTLQSITMGTCTASTTGCILDFSVNNPNSITLNGAGVNNFSVTGTGVRTLKLGSTTFTITNTNCNCWDATVTTSFTLNAGTSTIFIGSPGNGNSQTFAGGGLSYSTVSFGSRTNASKAIVSGSNTIATFLIAAPMSVAFAGTTTQTITNAINWAGTSSSSMIELDPSSSAQATLAVAVGSTINWAALRGMTFTGTTVIATNSFDMQSNVGVTITGPGGGGGRIIGG